MKKEKTIGTILFWATLISPMISLVLVCLIGEVGIFGGAGIIRYSWIMWLLIPIGVLSFIIGLILRKNKQSYKKNLVIACICIPLLLIFGSYRFVFNTITYDTNKVSVIENQIKLELPDDVKIATCKMDSYIATNKMDSYNVSYIKIMNDKSKVDFEQELDTNQLWQDELSPTIKSLLPVAVQWDTDTFDYCVFYNMTSGEYNTYPTDGVYECIFIAYNRELHRLIIVDDYKINITHVI